MEQREIVTVNNGTKRNSHSEQQSKMRNNHHNTGGNTDESIHRYTYIYIRQCLSRAAKSASSTPACRRTHRQRGKPTKITVRQCLKCVVRSTNPLLKGGQWYSRTKVMGRQFNHPPEGEHRLLQPPDRTQTLSILQPDSSLKNQSSVEIPSQHSTTVTSVYRDRQYPLKRDNTIWCPKHLSLTWQRDINKIYVIQWKKV